jgi:tripartite-type tricarboxylate transporter receptor subunit TctC
VKPKPLILACLIACILTSSCVVAERYPSRPIRVIVPLGAGGSVDILARSIGAELAKRLGQPVVIENKLGGGTLLGAEEVAHSSPDGYTLLAAPSGTLTIEPALHKKLPYDPLKSFVPIALYVSVPSVLVVNPSVPANSVSELITYVKQRPGKISYSAATVGGDYHLTGEIFKHDAGIDMAPVFYSQGGTAALDDIIAGTVPLGFADCGIARPLIAAKEIRALGVTSSARVPTLPDVPTIAESGLPGFEVVSWHMLLAPAGTPNEIVDRLRTELKAIFAEPQMKARMRALGLIPLDTPIPPVAELRAFLASEIARWGKVARQTGLSGSM